MATHSAELADKATEHLGYLSSCWPASEDLWKSWSRAGREAVLALGRSPEHVLTTTNHVESFNNVIKGRELPLWKRHGRRFRVDILLCKKSCHRCSRSDGYNSKNKN